MPLYTPHHPFPCISEIADFDRSWTPRMVPSLLVIQCFIDVQESQTALIQLITTTNQGLHGKLCIKKTETKEFTTSHYGGVIFPSAECWWNSVMGAK